MWVASACSSVLLLVGIVRVSGDSWSHSWDTASSAWWGDFGYSLLTEAQAEFVANNYFLASLEKCTGQGQGMKTEAAIYQTAAQLKRINPNVKVSFYWHTGQAGIGCYKENNTFMAHPEWWLRDDHGNIVGKEDPGGQIRIDCTVEEAVAWWISVPLKGENAADLIDGVLADGAGYESIPKHHSNKAEFDKIGRGGVVFANGIGGVHKGEYVDPYNKRLISAAAGVQNEHFAAFEQVDPKSGALQKDKVSNALYNIEWAAKSNASKQVFCSFWAGPYIGFSSDGWPKFADHSQPCGSNSSTGHHCTSNQRYQGWQEELSKYLPFNLAAFLTVAQANTWFTQAVWYEDHQGFFPCPDNPASCAMPPGFYSDYFTKPLGAPKGDRKKVGTYKWVREFEHASVTLDLNAPLTGSGIAFHSSAISV